MKVLLLEHPRLIAEERCNDIANTPLSSSLLTGYIAGTLQAEGHEVRIVEGHLDKLSYPEIAGLINTFDPDMVGVHMVYTWAENRELSAFLKDLKKAGIQLIAVYGFYPTFAYDEILRDCPAIDAVIVGEPEQTFAQLAAGKPSGGKSEGIPGLARQGEEGIRLGRREPMGNLDRLPYPVRTEAMLRLPEINVEGSRGCYGGCTFCYINPYYGKPAAWRGRSPEHIIAEIDGLLDRYGQRDIYFVDPNFFGPGQPGKERVKRLAALIKERHIHFGIEGRVNDITEETVSVLAEAGLRQILIGLESGRNESLRRLKKMTTVEQNEKALGILRQYGIQPNVGFIMFEPDSSLADIRCNFEFLQRNHLLEDPAITANVLYHPLIILQGTKAYQDLRRAGRLQLSATTYEGTAPLVDSRVAALARMTGNMTNYVFRQMAEIWSGKGEEPEEGEEVYRLLNRFLVRSFAGTLKELELGKRFSEQDMAAWTEQVRKDIDRLLSR